MTWLPRVFGVLTAVYGLATLVRPAIFAKPAGLSGDEPPAPVTPVRIARALAGRAQAGPRALMRCTERPPAVRAIRGGRRAGPGG